MPPNNSAPTPADPSLKFLVLIALYFSLHILLRVAISDSLDYDEAEQALLGQWLLSGYTEQPPLYSWLQHFFFRLFGTNVFAVSLLKNLLLFLTYVLVFLSGRLILRDGRAAVLAACSLLLIPQIAWESQRDMTHTTLVVFAAAATLYQTLRTVDRQSLTNYLLLGLCVGIGILSKANYSLFIIILLLTLMSSTEGRGTLFHRYSALALLVAITLSGQYLLWMYHNQEIVFSASHKFARGVENASLLGLESLLSNGLLYLTPLWLFYLIVFPSGYGLTDNFSPGFAEKFIRRYLFVTLLVLLLTVLALKVSYVKDRWLQPLFFAVPLVFFSRVSPQKISAGRFKAFCILVIIAAIGVYTAFFIRIAGVSVTKSYPKINYPFSAMAKDISQTGFTGGLIISDSRFLAGNMFLQFATGTAIIPDYHFESVADTDRYERGLVIWDADRSPGLPVKLANFLRSNYTIETENRPVSYLSHPYKFSRDETVTLGVMEISLNKPLNKS